MLEFTLKYCPAIDDIAANKAGGLRKYELDNDEWEIAEQLYNTLKVRGYGSGEIRMAHFIIRFSRTRHCTFRAQP